MHRMTSLESEKKLHAFIEEAAACFNSDPKFNTYTSSGRIEEGELFAVRWGLDDNCIMVFMISEDMTPTIYQNVVKRRSNATS